MSHDVALKNGEVLVCRIIDDPDDDDVPQLLGLLGHKGEPWNLHLDAWRDDTIKKLDTRFYVGRIADDLAGNIMVVDYHGIGLMGHVFTPPEHRRKGICDALMDFHLDHLRKEGSRAVYLGTGYESPPFHIYERHGYRPILGRPGSMWWSSVHEDLDDLHADFYGDLDRAEPSGIEWHHWPSMNVFTHVPFQQSVRNVSYNLYGISDSEWNFLVMKRDADALDDVQAHVLETRDGHVCGMATLAPERRWGRLADSLVFDLCVHPDAVDSAPELIEEFDWPDTHVLAYAAEMDDVTIDLLADAGFSPHSHVERFFSEGVGLVVMARD